MNRWKLPPVNKVTQRSKKEVDEVVEGLCNEGKHIYIKLSRLSNFLY